MDDLLTMPTNLMNDLENDHQPLTYQKEPEKTAPVLDFDMDLFLKDKMGEFEKNKRELIQDYLLKSQEHLCESQTLKFFTSPPVASNLSFESILSSEPQEDNVTSVYIRWNNQGLLINPSIDFLKNFHQQGHFLHEINYVIVTTDSSLIHAEVKKIHRFNTLLNTYNSDIHVIQYFLNHVSHQELARFLKPNYKQEKNTVHLLELFKDSPEVEKQQLSDSICLHYFPIAKKDGFVSYQERDLLSPSLGLRVELRDPHSHQSTLVGFLANCIWSPLLAHHVGLCDILITSFGFTAADDLEKRKYNDSCLGYYGTASLLEEIQPKFLCCMEFSTRHGDLRLELMQKLRQDFEQCQTIVCHPAILPADDNLEIHLENLLLKCSLTRQWVDPQQIKIIKTNLNFGALSFLHPACCL